MGVKIPRVNKISCQICGTIPVARVRPSPPHPSWYLFVGVPDQKIDDRKIHNHNAHRLYTRFKFPIINCLSKTNKHIPRIYFSDVYCIGYVRPYPIHFTVRHFVKCCSVLTSRQKMYNIYIKNILYIVSTPTCFNASASSQGVLTSYYNANSFVSDMVRVMNTLVIIEA